MEEASQGLPRTPRSAVTAGGAPGDNPSGNAAHSPGTGEASLLHGAADAAPSWQECGTSCHIRHMHGAFGMGLTPSSPAGDGWSSVALQPSEMWQEKMLIQSSREEQRQCLEVSPGLVVGWQWLSGMARSGGVSLLQVDGGVSGCRVGVSATLRTGLFRQKEARLYRYRERPGSCCGADCS